MRNRERFPEKWFHLNSTLRGAFAQSVTDGYGILDCAGFPGNHAAKHNNGQQQTIATGQGETLSCGGLPWRSPTGNGTGWYQSALGDAHELWRCDSRLGKATVSIK
jgi:hypothetical protein